MRRDRVVHRILAGCILVSMGSLPLIASCRGDFPELTRGMSYYDGTKVITLEQGQKLVNVTWKKDTVWYLVRPMQPGELPERYEFHEDSPFEGTHGRVIIQEKAKAFP